MNSAIDTSEGAILEALNNKLDRDTGNITGGGKQTVTGWGFPSNRYIELTLGASGSIYTAPANGYARFVALASTSASSWAQIKSGMFMENLDHSRTNAIFVGIVPVMKNENFTISYGETKDMTLKFIYAEGADNE